MKRNKYQLNGKIRHNLFIKRICETSSGNSIPLMYPEVIISSYILWKTDPDHFSIIESIPAPLLSECNNKHRFEYITDKIQQFLTIPV